VCVNIGHAREEMAQAIADQVRRLCYYSPFGLISTPPSIELAPGANTPGDLKQCVLHTGSTAVIPRSVVLDRGRRRDEPERGVVAEPPHLVGDRLRHLLGAWPILTHHMPPIPSSILWPSES